MRSMRGGKILITRRLYVKEHVLELWGGQVLGRLWSQHSRELRAMSQGHVLKYAECDNFIYLRVVPRGENIVPWVRTAVRLL